VGQLLEPQQATVAETTQLLGSVEVGVTEVLPPPLGGGGGLGGEGGPAGPGGAAQGALQVEPEFQFPLEQEANVTPVTQVLKVVQQAPPRPGELVTPPFGEVVPPPLFPGGALVGLPPLLTGEEVGPGLVALLTAVLPPVLGGGGEPLGPVRPEKPELDG
jgi:hypothetical protein